MNDLPDGVVSWPAEQLSDAERAEYAAAGLYLQQIERVGQRAGLFGWFSGVVGLAVGALGIGAAAVQYYRPPEPGRWMAVDNSTGWMGEPISARDATRIINDKARMSLVRGLISACEGYEAPVADLRFHECAIMLSPAQQKVYDTRAGKAVVRPKGFIARVEPAMRIWPRSDAPKGAYGYEVHFLRTEYRLGAKPETKPWTAVAYFTLNPAAPIAPLDALINPAGFVALSYDAKADAP